MPCACLSCRQLVTIEASPFRHIRQEREVKVSKQKDQAPLRITGHDLLYEKEKGILQVDRVTKNVLVEQLRLRNQALTGTKDILATRLLAFEASQSEIGNICPPQQPLAITSIKNDSIRLDDAGSDNDSNGHHHVTLTACNTIGRSAHLPLIIGSNLVTIL